MQTNISKAFKKIFKKVETLLKSIDKNHHIKMTRLVGYKKNRTFNTNCPEEYFRIAINVFFYATNERQIFKSQENVVFLCYH